MNITYTKLYPYNKKVANPTLLALEELDNGLTKLRGEPVEITDLLETIGSSQKNKARKV